MPFRNANFNIKEEEEKSTRTGQEGFESDESEHG